MYVDKNAKITLATVAFVGGIVGCVDGGGNDAESSTSSSGKVFDGDPSQASTQDLVVGTANINMDTDQLGLLTFNKEAGKTYRIDLYTNRGDFDLYGHWRSDFDPWSGTLASTRGGVSTDTIEFKAQESGPYYILVHAFSGGSARLELDVSGQGTQSDDPMVVDGFDYPVHGNSGPYATHANDGDGYYNAQDFAAYFAGRGYHCGEDWNNEAGGSSDYGDPVYAVANGRVEYSSNAGGGWGNIITINHKIPGAGSPDYEVIQSQYAHLSRRTVSSGDYVRRGQKIGEIGDADGAYPNAAHLHFEMRWDENQPPGGSAYDCRDEATGMFDPSEFIDTHRTWP